MIETTLPIEYHYEKRKSICLKSNLPYGFIVKAPKNISQEIIEKFIQSKKKWLINIEKSMKKSLFLLFPKGFSNGESITYLNNQYIIKHIKKNSKIKIYFDKINLVIETPEYYDLESIKKHIKHFYKQLAYDIFFDRTTHFCKLLNIDTPTIRLKTQKTRWGSCSTKKNINLNWLLIKAPLDVIDYVILHECCHLIHMNHSPAFWDLIKRTMPNYKLKEQWLDSYGPMLMANLNIIK